MEALLERTTREDQRIAKSSLDKVRETSRRMSRSLGSSIDVNIKIQESEEFLKIPRKAIALLFDILSNMAEGKSITLIPSDTVVSTQQAADLLNVSRPHLVKLLEEGKIPYTKVGVHRRIDLKDIIEYDKKIKENRKSKLDFLAKEGQDLNLGY